MARFAKNILAAVALLCVLWAGRTSPYAQSAPSGRGAARLQVRVQNIDALVDAVKSVGLTIVTDGGGSVPIPPNFKGSLVADPSNFFFTLFEPCDGCAPRELPASSR